MEKKIKLLEHELFTVQHTICAYLAKLENPELEVEEQIAWPIKLDRLQKAIDNL